MLWIMVGLMILILLVLIRALIGPTLIDRIISVNAITSKGSMIILLLAFYIGDYGFVDIAIVFMLCGFIGGLWIMKVFTPSVWSRKLPELNKLEGNGKGTSKND